MTKNCMHLIPCHHGREYKGERSCPKAEGILKSHKGCDDIWHG